VIGGSLEGAAKGLLASEQVGRPVAQAGDADGDPVDSIPTIAQQGHVSPSTRFDVS
jgi:hypothetical protein